MNDIKVMNAEDFRNEGFLQEVNRQFFHPLGLALALDVDSGIDDEGYIRVQIWDERDDPEGWFFAEGELSQEKADKVYHIKDSKRTLRNALLGHVNIYGGSPVQEINEVPK